MTAKTMITETAPAKINLFLHIGPTRPDGLHDLASLFVFAKAGDVVRAAPADTLSLTICGPHSASLQGLPEKDNLVWRAVEMLRDFAGVDTGARITLQKNLPIAAGVGGGSADAAATLRALVRLWRVEISEDALVRLAFRLGADVPACLSCSPVNVSGAGEQISKGPTLPPLWVCLVNPGVAMPTGPIFSAFDQAHPAPLPPLLLHMGAANYRSLEALMEGSRNDFEPFALVRAPQIRAVLQELSVAPGALGARMSGSGATCFALFASRSAAVRTANRARARGWWAMASALHVR